MQITVERIVNAPLQRVWNSWSNPTEIQQWNAPSDDWDTTHSRVDLREGGDFLSAWKPRMAALASTSRGPTLESYSANHRVPHARPHMRCSNS